VSKENHLKVQVREFKQKVRKLFANNQAIMEEFSASSTVNPLLFDLSNSSADLVVNLKNKLKIS
jgi:hypothetical protein